MNMNDIIGYPYLSDEVTKLGAGGLIRLIRPSLAQADSLKIPFGDIVKEEELANEKAQKIAKIIDSKGYPCKVQDELVGLNYKGYVARGLYQRYLVIKRKEDEIR